MTEPITEIRPRSGGLLDAVRRVPPTFLFLVALAVMLGIGAAFRSGHYLSPAIVLPLLATLYAMAYLSLRQRNLRLYLRGDVVGKVTGLGRRIEVPKSEVAEFRLLSVSVPNVSPLRLLLALDRSRRRLLTVGRAYQFDPGELREFATGAGIPLSGSLEEMLTLERYEAEYPGAAGGSLAMNPGGQTLVLTAAGMTVAILAFIAVVVIQLHR